MDDFDVAPDKVGESSQRVMNRAVEGSRRPEHATVANEHLFLASRTPDTISRRRVMSPTFSPM